MGTKPWLRRFSAGLGIDGCALLTSRQYRDHAAECLRLARQATCPEDMALLLAMAEGWRVLAEKATDMEPTIPYLEPGPALDRKDGEKLQ